MSQGYFLTSNSALTVVNGGTGSSTVSGARSGLGILSGTATLAAGTITISAAITASSRIMATIKDANPGAGNLTVGVSAPNASRNVGAGTFTVQADVAAGTINILDTSTIDWIVVG